MRIGSKFNRLFVARAIAAAVVVVAVHAVLRAGIGAPPSFSPTPANQRNGEGDVVSVVIGATNTGTPSFSYTVSAVNTTTGVAGAGSFGLPAGLTASTVTGVGGAKVLSIVGTLGKSTAGADDGSVGLYTVTVTVTDANGTPGSNTAQAVFTWDVSRWNRGDLFQGIGAPCLTPNAVDPLSCDLYGSAAAGVSGPNPIPMYAVYDKDGNWKRTVAIQDIPPASETLADPWNPGQNFVPAGWTAQCAVNYQTGEVWAANFDDIYPGINYIGRQPKKQADGSYWYSDPSRRVSTRRAAVDASNNSLGMFPVDIDPESIVFNNAQNFFVGHSFGFFNDNGDASDANGHPVYLNGVVVDVNGDPILTQSGDFIDPWTWRNPNGYYGAPVNLLGLDGNPIPVRRQFGQDLHRYNYDSTSKAWPTRNFFDTWTVSTGTDQMDLASDGRIFYTSESNYVLVFNPVTGQQLPVFGGGPLTNDTYYGLRLLPPGDGTGGFLVVNTNNILRVNGSGQVVQAYDINNDPDYPSTNGGVDGYYSIDIDPDARTFWVNNHADIFHFDIATGKIIPVGPNGARKIRVYNDPFGQQHPAELGGMCVMQEYTAAKEICGDGIDNDGNGLIDENCKAIEICSPEFPGDDNGDGLADANDPQCGAPAGVCATNADGSPAPTSLSVGGFCSRQTPEGTVVSLPTMILPCATLATAADPTACAGWSTAFSATGLPPGLRIDPVTGVIVGSPSYAIVTNSPTAPPVGFTVTVNGSWLNPATGVTTQFTKAFPWSITNTNQAPTPHDDAATVNAGQAVAIPVLANDTDPDGDTISLVSFTQPARGSVVQVGSQLQYTAPAGASGTVNFTYTVQDSYTPAATATATVVVTIVAGPTATNDAYAALAGQTLTVTAANGVLKNDTDPQGRTLTVIAGSVSTPAHGTVSMNTDGSFTYSPVAGYAGTDTFTYQDSNGTLTSNTATVTITVNLPPVAVNDAYTMPAAVPVLPLVIGPVAGLLLNDSDPAHLGPLQVVTSSVTAPSHGVVVVAADGSFVYTPVLNFTGVDTFTYKVTDGTYASNPATVTITIRGTNRPPVAVNDSYQTIGVILLNVYGTTGVLVNDSDPDNDTITAVLVSGPSHGTLLGLDASGGFGYQANAGFFGTDTFTYKAFDGVAYSNVATVTIRVDGPPSAVNDAYTTPSGTALPVAAPGLLANDWDPDPADAVSVVTNSLSVPAHGTVVANANGSFTYTPVAGYHGTDSFTYQVTDGFATSNVALVTITITDRPPVAVNDAYTVNQNATLTTTTATGVRANDSDPDDPTSSLTVALVTGVAHGTLTLNADGSFVYTPTPGYSGTDSFTYQVKDSSGLISNTATVNLTIAALPVAVNDTYTTPSGTALTAAAPGVMSNDTNPSGLGTLSAALVTSVTHGTLVLNATGGFTYTPTAGYRGTDAFTYTVSNGSATSNVATATITITDRPPVAVDNAYSTPMNTALTVAVAAGIRANDSDPDDATSTLTVAVVSGVSHGTLTLNADGSFVYTPTTGYFGADAFTYQAKDPSGLTSNTATVTITITGLPAANNDAFMVAEDTSLSVSAATGVRLNDTDPSGPTSGLTVTLVSGVSHGVLALAADGSFVYTPALHFFGTDTFTYTVKNPLGLVSNVATVTITVNFVNHPPVALNSAYVVAQGQTLTVPVGTGVRVGASDVEDANAALKVQQVSGASQGTVTLAVDGSFVYTAPPTFLGPTATFTYQVKDTLGALSNVATATITIIPIVSPTCSVGYPFTSTEPRTSIVFNENEVLRAFAHAGTGSGETIRVWYSDERPLALGVRQVNVKTSAGTTTTNYPVAPLATNPSSALNPAVGSTILTGDQAGTDLSGRPVYPALFITDITFDQNARSGDWQYGGTAIAPHAVFGTWKSAVRSVDNSRSTPRVTIIGDADPAKNNWSLGSGSDAPPAGTTNQGFGTEVRWNVNDLRLNGAPLQLGHIYRVQFMVHDGDQNKAGGDVGQACLNLTPGGFSQPLPVAIDDAFTARKNTALAIPAPGVLGNDSDPNGAALTAALVASPSHGTVALAANGGFTYTPALNFTGTDTFTYRDTNSAGLNSNVATVVITVIAHWAGDGCDHDKKKPGHRDGDGCDHDKVIHSGHWDGDGCDHKSSWWSWWDGHRDGDGCDHDQAMHSGHYDGDGCDHDKRKAGHKDGDSCAHDDAIHTIHQDGDGCDHDSMFSWFSGHYDGDGCDHDRYTQHDDGDNCDHERGVNGHFKGDACDHDRHHHGK